METQREQRMQEERLKQREAELEQREYSVMQRELNIIMMGQQQQSATTAPNLTPTPKKRKGKFRKRLLKKEPSLSSSSIISGPLDFRHNISLTPSRTELSAAEASLANGKERCNFVTSPECLPVTNSLALLLTTNPAGRCRPAAAGVRRQSRPAPPPGHRT